MFSELRNSISLSHVIVWFLGAVVIVLLIIYGLFQARFLISGPILTLSTEPPYETTDSVITLKGQAQNIIELTLNGRTIYTTDDGSFSEALILASGYTVVTFEGTDRYGNTTRLERTIVKKN